MTKLQIPNEVLEKMVCLTCKYYLSVFPIFTKTDSSGAICGRCKVTDNTKYIRDEAYEGIAQFLLFPCMHVTSGCKENLTPPKLEDHEKCCKFRKFDCPSTNYSKCEWQGPRTELIVHFQTKHTDLLLTNASFEISFGNSHEQKVLFSKDEQLFMVKKEVDARKGVFICSVQHLRAEEEGQQYNFFLKVMSADKNYHYRTSEKSTGEEDSIKLSEGFLRDKLYDTPSFIVNVEIVKPVEPQPMDTEVTEVPEKKKSEDVDWDMIRDVECPICFEFMHPPVFQCNKGHTICHSCNEKVEICPSCKGEMKGTRNFSLEKMIQRMTYPCKHHKSGCSYSCKSTDIAEHERGCKYGPYVCPMSPSGCQWDSSNVNTTIIDHIENNHADSVLKSEKVDIPFSRNELNEKIYLIKFAKMCFKLAYKYENEKFFWEVQFVGTSELAKRFRFEIDVIDLSSNKRRCYLTGLVSVLTNQDFQDPNKVVVSLEQVQTFIKDVFSFRVRIIKD